MRVLVNRSAALGRKTGVGHYTSELLRCLQDQAGAQLAVTPPEWLWRIESLWARVRPADHSAAPANPDAAPRQVSPRGRVMKALRGTARDAIRRHVCVRAARSGCDLYHEPNHIPLPIDLPTLVTIHDLSVLLHPQWHPAARVLEFERDFTRSLANVCHFLAVSEFTRQEMMHYLGIAPERISVTPNGTRGGLGPLPSAQVAPVLQALGLPREYLLYVGTIEPRKNLLNLLHAYGALPASLRNRWPLVLAGGWGWKADAIRDYLDREGRARGVMQIGYVEDHHLAGLYNGARALVYPSHYEGFGLPPIEMHACGGAVLASTAGALKETVGSQAHLVPPDDVDGWRDAMQRVLEDDDWWQSLRQGAQASVQHYTWERCAAVTLDAYRGLIQGPPLARMPHRRMAG